MRKRIVVPVDFSPATEDVIARAQEMARAFEAELHLVHVREIAALPAYPAATIGYPGLGMPEIGMTPAPAGIVPEAVPNEKRTRLEELARELAGAGLKVSVHEPEGAVVHEILQTATAVSADLIVMGSHGHGAVYNLLVGSVTEGVLKAAKCPVLLVPARGRA